MGKPTARIARTVISIVCALYVVKAGNGRIHVRDGCFGAETVGDAGWLEGREGPLSRCGMRRRKPVGVRIKRDRTTGRSAKSDIDRRRGTTRRTMIDQSLQVGSAEGVRIGLDREILRTTL